MSEYVILSDIFNNSIFNFIAKIESPPSSKKLSVTPIGEVERISSNILASFISKSVLGETNLEDSSFFIFGKGRAFFVYFSIRSMWKFIESYKITWNHIVW